MGDEARGSHPALIFQIFLPFRRDCRYTGLTYSGLVKKCAGAADYFDRVASDWPAPVYTYTILPPPPPPSSNRTTARRVRRVCPLPRLFIGLNDEGKRENVLARDSYDT